MELPHPPELKSKKRGRRSRRAPSWTRHLPLMLFAIMVAIGPALFGAVDRPVQITLAVLLGIGLFLRPPAELSNRARLVFAVLFALLIAEQFIPWSEVAQWRSELGEDLHVTLPWTRHPEPSRAIDPLLAIVLGFLWFRWVAGLAEDRTQRLWMCWILVGAGVLMAILCFVFKGEPSGKIFGIRETLGWVGWGPFPNRNHTASFLAMSALIAAGASFWAIASRNWIATIAGGCAFTLSAIALLASKSRGGLVAFGAGLLVLLVFALVRKRDRKTGLVALSVLILTTTLVFAFGRDVIGRFTSQEAGAVSNDLRRQIWSDTSRLWQDEPWFGQGLATFPQIFPIYTSHDFGGSTVYHPESSWLLWLSEVGVLPVIGAGLALLYFLIRGIRRAFVVERRSFYLTAAALAAVAALLTHSIIDVPAHRWGTLGLAMALLAVALPAESERWNSRLTAVLPLLIAGFWILPFFFWMPWTTTHLAKLEARERAAAQDRLIVKPDASHAQWAEVLRFFPIDVRARQFTGLALLAESPTSIADAQQHFAVVRRLAASSWAYSVEQALALGSQFPARSIAAWQDAILRAGAKRTEVLRTAVSESAGYPGAKLLWGQFIELHPELALTYARTLLEQQRLSSEDARPYFDLWWEQRGSIARLNEAEIADFHVLAAQFADVELVERWIKRHTERRDTDFRHWVRIYVARSEFEKAWQVYASVVPEPVADRPPAGSSRASADEQYRANPGSANAALTLVQHMYADGNATAADELILKVAALPDAPVWFIRKGAHRLAANMKFEAAVTLALRDQK